LSKYNKFIWAAVSLAATAAQAVVAAKGFTTPAGISAIVTAVIGSILVHQIPNSHPAAAPPAPPPAPSTPWQPPASSIQ